MRDICYVLAAGGKRTRIEVRTPNNLVPRMSPDGRSVMYLVWDDAGDLSLQAVRRPAGDAGWSRATPLFTVPSTNTGSADWSPDGRLIAYVQDSQLVRADADGKNPRPIAAMPADFLPFFTRWGGDSRTVYFSGARTDGRYLIYAVPVAGGPPREVAHSEGPTFQNFRFTFNVRGSMLSLPGRPAERHLDGGHA